MSSSGGSSSVVGELSRELQRVQQRRGTVYPGARLENSAFRILWVLADGVPRTFRQLAEALDVGQSTMNRQVNAAIRAGFLERFEPVGRGSWLVRPTRLGMEAFEHDDGVRTAVFGLAIAHLSEARARSLVAVLREFNDAWDAEFAASSGGV